MQSFTLTARMEEHMLAFYHLTTIFLARYGSLSLPMFNPLNFTKLVESPLYSLKKKK